MRSVLLEWVLKIKGRMVKGYLIFYRDAVIG
jgi:hypothetical protein